jgi:TRAP transporter TAXI family solute receptor
MKRTVGSRQLPVALGIAAACIVMSGCSGEGAGSGGVRRLSIATGGTGGVYYPYGGGIAKVLTEHLPNVEATAEVTAASVDNLKFLKQGTSDIAFSTADTAADGVAGRDLFQSFGPVPVQTLAVLYTNAMHLVTTAGSGINNVSDLRGKVVSVGAPGGGTAMFAERILAAAGIDPQRGIRSQGLGVAQSVDALKDGKLDAFFWGGGIPTAAILDLVNTAGITAHFVPLDDILPALQEKYGESLYYPFTIPKGAYSLQRDVPAVAVTNVLVVSETMPEELAHDITRVLFEQQPVLATIHPQARELTLESAVEGSPIPFHPGAIRYYRERGAWKQ